MLIIRYIMNYDDYDYIIIEWNETKIKSQINFGHFLPHEQWAFSFSLQLVGGAKHGIITFRLQHDAVRTHFWSQASHLKCHALWYLCPAHSRSQR